MRHGRTTWVPFLSQSSTKTCLSGPRGFLRYATLVAGDFGSFAPPEIMRILREEQQTRDICKKR
jgi:hypothetical protein